MKKCIFLTSVVIIGLLAGGCGSSSASSGYKAPAADQPAAETQGFVSQLFDDPSGSGDAFGGSAPAGGSDASAGGTSDVGGDTAGGDASEQSGSDSYWYAGLDTDVWHDADLIKDEPEPVQEERIRYPLDLPEELFYVPSWEYNDEIALFCARLSDLAEADDYGNTLCEEYIKRGAEDAIPYNYRLKGELKIMDLDTEGGAFVVGHFPCEDGTVFLVITSRGTKTLGEKIGDVFKGYAWDPNKVHYVLNQPVWDNVYDFKVMIDNGVEDYLSRHPEVFETEKLRVVVTGHSLGGAAANFYAACLTDAVDRGAMWSGVLSREAIYVYTYGAINVLSSKKNASAGFENIHNIYNYYDSFGTEGNYAFLGVGSSHSKFGHTDIYKDEELHYDEGELSDMKFTLTTNNHNMDNYIAAIEKNKSTGGAVIDLSCDSDSSQAKPDSDTGDFEIEGTWKSIGSYGLGQAQPGCYVTFDGTHVNFVSPYDSYAFYREGDVLKLSCTTYMFADTLSFTVEVLDNNHILVDHGGAVTELERVSASGSGSW